MGGSHFALSVRISVMGSARLQRNHRVRSKKRRVPTVTSVHGADGGKSPFKKA